MNLEEFKREIRLESLKKPVVVKQAAPLYLSRRRKPIDALALYEVPSPQKEPVHLPERLKEVSVIDCRQGIDELQLRGLLTSLLQGSTA